MMILGSHRYLHGVVSFAAVFAALAPVWPSPAAGQDGIGIGQVMVGRAVRLAPGNGFELASSVVAGNDCKNGANGTPSEPISNRISNAPFGAAG